MYSLDPFEKKNTHKTNLIRSKYGEKHLNRFKFSTPYFHRAKFKGNEHQYRSYIQLHYKKIFKSKYPVTVFNNSIYTGQFMVQRNGMKLHKKIIDVIKTYDFSRARISSSLTNGNLMEQLKNMKLKHKLTPDFVEFCYQYTHYWLRKKEMDMMVPDMFKDITDTAHISLLKISEARVQDLNSRLAFDTLKELRLPSQFRYVEVFDAVINVILHDTNKQLVPSNFFYFLYAGAEKWDTNGPMVAEMMDEIVVLENDILGFKQETANEHAKSLLSKGVDDHTKETYNTSGYTGSSTKTMEEKYEKGNDCFNAFISDLIVQGVLYPGTQGENSVYKNFNKANLNILMTNILRKVDMLYNISIYSKDNYSGKYLSKDGCLYLLVLLTKAVRKCVQDVYFEEPMQVTHSVKGNMSVYTDGKRIGTFLTIQNIFAMYAQNIHRRFKLNNKAFAALYLQDFSFFEHWNLREKDITLLPFRKNALSTEQKINVEERITGLTTVIFKNMLMVNKSKNLFMYLQVCYINEFMAENIPNNETIKDKNNFFTEAQVIMDAKSQEAYNRVPQFNLLVSTKTKQRISETFSTDDLNKSIQRLINEKTIKKNIWRGRTWEKFRWYNIVGTSMIYELTKLFTTDSKTPITCYRFKMPTMTIMADDMNYNVASFYHMLQPIEQMNDKMIYGNNAFQRILHGHFNFFSAKEGSSGHGFANKFFCCVKNARLNNKLTAYTGEISLPTFEYKLNITASGFGFNFPLKGDQYMGDWSMNVRNGWGVEFEFGENNDPRYRGIKTLRNGYFQGEDVKGTIKCPGHKQCGYKIEGEEGEEEDVSDLLNEITFGVDSDDESDDESKDDESKGDDADNNNNIPKKKLLF